MELRDDYALSTVYDERSEWSEDRKLPEVDFLLDDVFHTLLAALQGLIDDEAKSRLERRRVRHITFNTFLNLVLGLTQ